MQCKIDIAVVIGSGVPPALRAQGHRVCWTVLVNGEQRGSAFGSRTEAETCRKAWLAMFGLLDAMDEQAAASELDRFCLGSAQRG
jgi:hypothetical protein